MRVLLFIITFFLSQTPCFALSLIDYGDTATLVYDCKTRDWRDIKQFNIHKYDLASQVFLRKADPQIKRLCKEYFTDSRELQVIKPGTEFEIRFSTIGVAFTVSKDQKSLIGEPYVFSYVPKEMAERRKNPDGVVRISGKAQYEYKAPTKDQKGSLRAYQLSLLEEDLYQYNLDLDHIFEINSFQDNYKAYRDKQIEKIPGRALAWLALPITTIVSIPLIPFTGGESMNLPFFNFWAAAADGPDLRNYEDLKHIKRVNLPKFVDPHTARLTNEVTRDMYRYLYLRFSKGAGFGELYFLDLLKGKRGTVRLDLS